MATKKNEVQVVIPEIKLQQAQIRIVGTSPLVVHKFSEKAKRQMLEKQMKTAKTYRNHEYYPDPTAGRALENIEREAKRINRKPRKHRGKRRKRPCCKP
jgi:hypothetical protein